MQQVVLIHGIRTRAVWQDRIRRVLKSDSVDVNTANYGYFDIVSFLVPGWLRNRAVRKIEGQLRHVLSLKQPVTVIAYSFGSYAIAKILEKNPDIALKRLILCGAIVADDYKWDRISKQLRNDIVNEWS